MPYVNIQITKEGGESGQGISAAQKASLIKGVTELLQREIDKDPATTHVVISEVELANWGVGGMPVEAYRQALKG